MHLGYTWLCKLMIIIKNTSWDGGSFNIMASCHTGVLWEKRGNKGDFSLTREKTEAQFLDNHDYK